MNRTKKAVLLVASLVVAVGAFAAAVAVKDKVTKEKLAKCLCKVKKLKLHKK